jgi:hypothetical protein
LKSCSKCNIVKELNEFYKRKDSKDGYRKECKKCKDEVVKKYSENNKEKISEYKHNFYLENIEIIKERSYEWSLNNPDRIKEIGKKWRTNNKEIVNKAYLRRKERNPNQSKQYRDKNKDRMNEQQTQKRRTDPLYKLSCSMRSMLLKAFKRNGYKKASRTNEILCCSFEELKIYIESKFEDWMTWENHGKYNGDFNCGWDFDHITPLSSASSEDEIIRLNHYTNIQPMCSKINRDIKRDNKWI